MANGKSDFDAQKRIISIGLKPNKRWLLGAVPIEDSFPPIEKEGTGSLVVSSVWVPNIAFQFIPCLETLSIDPDALNRAMLSDVSGQFPRYTCLASNVGALGFWPHRSYSEAGEAAMVRGLESLDILGAGPSGNRRNFGVFINASYIDELAHEDFENRPKRYNARGTAVSDGPIQLTGLDVSFEAPDRIVTTVSIKDRQPWPDIHFKRIITDKLTVAGAVPSCESDERNEVVRRWRNLLNLLPGVITFTGHYAVERLLQWFVDNDDEDSSEPEGATGCSVVRGLPRSLLVPSQEGIKLNFAYRHIEVTSGGVFANGAMGLVARQQQVRIVGSTQTAAQPNSVISLQFEIRTTDLRPDLTIRWTSDGEVISPSKSRTSIRFSVQEVDPGRFVGQTVSVTVTDADGFVANATKEVRIYGLVEHPEAPDICLTKPWLPGCEPT